MADLKAVLAAALNDPTLRNNLLKPYNENNLPIPPLSVSFQGSGGTSYELRIHEWGLLNTMLLVLYKDPLDLERNVVLAGGNCCSNGGCRTKTSALGDRYYYAMVRLTANNLGVMNADSTAYVGVTNAIADYATARGSTSGSDIRIQF